MYFFHNLFGPVASETVGRREIPWPWKKKTGQLGGYPLIAVKLIFTTQQSDNKPT
jgi:hypothetical protein